MPRPISQRFSGGQRTVAGRAAVPPEPVMVPVDNPMVQAR
jgi:hypothetical protein